MQLTDHRRLLPGLRMPLDMLHSPTGSYGEQRNDFTFFIPIYIQQDATLHSLFYLETALHISGGTSTHHQEVAVTV